MSSSSSIAGTWDSRLRPLKPSAMLKTMSSGVLPRTLGSSGLASRSMTSWPQDAIASRMAWSVAGESYSASRSSEASTVGFTRLTL